ncbi:thiamine-phosphate kinase, partial [Campylobacter jejuni]|nr:thiamine-phosphate kinase [Campylobacter jejuni]
MNKEDFIIKAFLNEKNGDDGAVIDDWCFSNDLFFENVHFKRAWLSLEQIA